MTQHRPLVCLLLASSAVFSAMGSATEANPIRKVVTLMQDMQKEIEMEGDKEKELFEKYMCYCDSTTASLTSGVATAKSKISEYGSKLEEDTAAKSGTDQDLIQHKSDREGAQNDLNKATSIREKEEGEFAETAADLNANIAAMSGAIPALEKGMGSAAFMQLPGADRLRRLADQTPDAFDRQTLTAFLEGSSTGDYVPQSGQIVGILKQMGDDMQKSLADATGEEKSAAAGFADMKAAKQEEINVASSAIETKTALAGELAVSVVQNQDALDDATAELADNEKFLAELKAQCAAKDKEWAARQVARQTEVAAISEAIGILNDDDALDIFKKAIPASASLVSASVKMGFLQKATTNASRLAKARALISASASSYKNTQMKLLLAQLNTVSKAKSGTMQFDMIVKMITKMTGILEAEQAGDEKHKAHCEKEFASSAKEKEASKVATDSVTSTISDLGDQISQIAGDIATVEQEINALDLSVATATIQRKSEHAEHTEFVALNQAALQLIEKARQRLYKFYNPVLYKEPPKKELTMEEKITSAAGFNSPPAAAGAASSLIEIRSHRVGQGAAPPPPPPETFDAYAKKGEKSTGVLGLMTMIVKDLETDMETAATDEAAAQKDYEALMSESAVTRAQDAKSITGKEKSKAELETKMETAKESKALSVEEQAQIASVIYDLHGACDFLLENFDMRKEARTSELESLKNSMSVLSGANFSG